MCSCMVNVLLGAEETHHWCITVGATVDLGKALSVTLPVLLLPPVHAFIAINEGTGSELACLAELACGCVL